MSHTLRTWRRIVAAWLLSGTLSGLASERPNIVIFISDDLGRLETSVHGSSDVKTPTMDRLAAAGMVFENAYVASPSCCPNRYSLLTGLMPARHGAHPNHSKPKPGTKFLPPLLQSLGYYLASFGKVAHGRAGFPGCDFHSPMPREMHEHVVQHFQEQEIDGPVCLLVGDRRPHVAWTKQKIYDPTKLTLPSYFIDTQETREHWARYLSDITGMDEEMGRIYEFAKTRLGDNVIFVFTSDHGGQWPRGKWNLYDSGTRVPLIVTWPGKIPAGRAYRRHGQLGRSPADIDRSGGRRSSRFDRRAILCTHFAIGSSRCAP